MNDNKCNNILELYNIFKKIHNYGYIKSDLKDSGGAGNTFECLIGKKPDSKSLPDYKNIEIKTSVSSTSYAISLLSMMPITGNKSSNEMLQNFLNICGHYGIKNNNSKYFNDKITLNEVKYHYSYFIKSYIDINEDCIIIEFISYDLILIEKMRWPIEYIYCKLKNKSKFLAIVEVDKKKHYNNTYYKYNKIKFYKFKSKHNLLKALMDKKIFISFNLKLDYINNKYKVRYHGITFDIQKNNINSIYDNIYFD